MRPRMAYQEAWDKREHLLALGMTEIWLDMEPDNLLDENHTPLEHIVGFSKSGCEHRGIFTRIQIKASRDDLDFVWDVDVTKQEGPYHNIDEDTLSRLVEVVLDHGDDDLEIQLHNLLAEVERELNNRAMELSVKQDEIQSSSEDLETIRERL